MAIMLAGVEYPEIDTTIQVPKISNNIPIDTSINTPKIINNEKIDNDITIPDLTTDYIDSSLYRIFLKENEFDLNLKIPNISGENVDTSLNTPNIEIESRFSFQNWINEKIPTFSKEYLDSLHNFQFHQSTQRFGSYTKEFNEIVNKIDTVLFGNNKLFAVIRIPDPNLPPHLWEDPIKRFGPISINKSMFELDTNSNLYGTVPTGFVYSVDKGKVRWEEVEWRNIDPFLAANGIIKLGNDPILRPDLILKRTNKVDVRSRSYTKPNMGDTNGLTEASNILNVNNYMDHHYNENIPNRSLHFLMSSGADFLKHMFDIAIVIQYKHDAAFKTFKESLEKIGKRSLLDNFDIRMDHITGRTNESVLMVRTSTIEVPQMENETFTTKFLGMTVTKVRSKVRYERKSNLKMLLDEPLYIRLLFNILSGTSRLSTLDKGWWEDKNYDYKPKSFYAANLNVYNDLNLNIIIKHQALLSYPYLSIMKNTWRTVLSDDKVGYAENHPDEYPLWWFQDVKFMGEGNDLQFDRDGSSVTELTFPFLFSRCLRVDRSKKMAGQDGPFFAVSEDNNHGLTNVDEITHLQGGQKWMYKNPFWKK
jgi:hypothetical protein